MRASQGVSEKKNPKPIFCVRRFRKKKTLSRGVFFLKRRTQTKFFFPSNTRLYQKPPPLRKFWGYKSLSTLLTSISLKYAYSLSRWIVLLGTGQSGKVKPERILK